MQINHVSNDTNFKAKFAIDKQGMLKDLYQKYKVTPRALKLADELENIGKGQELEFVGFKHIYYILDADCEYTIDENIVDIFNRTTGKTMTIKQDVKKHPFWDRILSVLTSDKTFYEADTKESKFWQKITGQKV